MGQYHLQQSDIILADFLGFRLEVKHPKALGVTLPRGNECVVELRKRVQVHDASAPFQDEVLVLPCHREARLDAHSHREIHEGTPTLKEHEAGKDRPFLLGNLSPRRLQLQPDQRVEESPV